MTVKVVYIHLPEGTPGTLTIGWPGELIKALDYFKPDSVINLKGKDARIDLVYIWPGDLEEHEALKVWRQSRAGLAYSMKGIRGPYTPAAERW